MCEGVRSAKHGVSRKMPEPTREVCFLTPNSVSAAQKTRKIVKFHFMRDGLSAVVASPMKQRLSSNVLGYYAGIQANTLNNEADIPDTSAEREKNSRVRGIVYVTRQNKCKYGLELFIRAKRVSNCYIQEKKN